MLFSSSFFLRVSNWVRLLPLLSHQDNLVRLQAVTTLSDLAGTARYTVRLGDRMSPFLRLQPSKRPGAALFPMQSVFDALVERLRKEDRSEVCPSPQNIAAFV
jgi:hypothetical protein